VTGQHRIFEEIIAKSFQNLINENNINTEETYQIANKMNSKLGTTCS
jgi:hypothetical protein